MKPQGHRGSLRVFYKEQYADYSDVLTVDEAAEMVKVARDSVGMTKIAISQYEQGITLPDIKMIIKLANLYKVPCSYLLLQTDSKVVPEVTTNYIPPDFENALEMLTESGRAYSQLGEAQQKIFLEMITNLNTLLRYSQTLNLPVLMGHTEGLCDFHHATTELIRLNTILNEMAMERYCEFIPKAEPKQRYSSKLPQRKQLPETTE